MIASLAGLSSSSFCIVQRLYDIVSIWTASISHAEVRSSNPLTSTHLTCQLRNVELSLSIRWFACWDLSLCMAFLSSYLFSTHSALQSTLYKAIDSIFMKLLTVHLPSTTPYHSTSSCTHAQSSSVLLLLCIAVCASHLSLALKSNLLDNSFSLRLCSAKAWVYPIHVIVRHYFRPITLAMTETACTVPLSIALYDNGYRCTDRSNAKAYSIPTPTSMSPNSSLSAHTTSTSTTFVRPLESSTLLEFRWKSTLYVLTLEAH